MRGLKNSRRRTRGIVIMRWKHKRMRSPFDVLAESHGLGIKREVKLRAFGDSVEAKIQEGNS